MNMETKKPSKLKWAVVRFPEIVAGIALTFAISLATINAFTRYALSFTIKGSDEYICIAFAWLVFLGGAAAFRRNMHYGIDLVVNFFPKKARAVVDLFTRILITFIMYVLTYLSVLLCVNVRGKIFTATHISYLALDLAVLVGFGLMAVYSTVFLIKDVKKTAAVLCGKDKEVAK